MKKEKIKYDEGFIKLNDEMTTFDFKSISFLHEDIISIIDMYDNLIKIPYRSIWYIFFHANNKRNEGCDKICQLKKYV